MRLAMDMLDGEGEGNIAEDGKISRQPHYMWNWLIGGETFVVSHLIAPRADKRSLIAKATDCFSRWMASASRMKSHG